MMKRPMYKAGGKTLKPIFDSIQNFQNYPKKLEIKWALKKMVVK